MDPFRRVDELLVWQLARALAISPPQQATALALALAMSSPTRTIFDKIEERGLGYAARSLARALYWNAVVLGKPPLVLPGRFASELKKQVNHVFHPHYTSLGQMVGLMLS